ncbi:hypothetical protein M3610_03740 [Neobacillus sp. MER 74]|uniref:hypothetical protein n=1 Tax=Neobacillus sp. MER 74 TaxID=2939566 RepID=UPI002041C2AF|nr:hypothetical protein [Neobacillus sp. MER 74]MCM3114408.1 hypothetical protein [Neobacillus sp. MER 74]
MKRFLLFVSAIMMAIGLSACSSNDEAKTDKKETTEKTASKVDVKKELVRFYMDLGNKINAKDADLNAYVAKATKEDATPEELPNAEDRAKASESAASVAAELNTYQIPASLKDKKADLDAAIKDFAASYQAKADELKKETPNFDAATATFTQGEEKLGKVFESEKLLPPGLDKQVN